jgi:hypothetical protein
MDMATALEQFGTGPDDPEPEDNARLVGLVRLQKVIDARGGRIIPADAPSLRPAVRQAMNEVLVALHGDDACKSPLWHGESTP